MQAQRGRLIKGGIAALLALAVAAGSAQADPRDRRGRDFGRGDGRGYEQSSRPDRDAQRAQRSEEQRQRLSPEERRQLRRDVQDAGRELYPRRR